MRYFIVHIIICFLFFSYPVNGAGVLGTGIYFGLAQDMNNLEKTINQYNQAMEQYKSAHTGTEVVQLNSPYETTFGLSLDYTFNMFRFKTAAYYSHAYVYPTMGSIRSPAGSRNTIRFTSHQLLVPLTLGLTFSLSKQTFLFCGFGPTFAYTSLVITQSKPDPAYGLPDSTSKDTFSDLFIAFHFVLGFEIPLSGTISLCSEWQHTAGVSEYIISDNSANKRCIDITSDIVLFGVKYYFAL